MPEPLTPGRIEARHDRTESARLDSFVDAAFAFAITLLIISRGSLPQDAAGLERALRDIPAFAACFAQLALFWHGHVQWRDATRLTDATSLLLSLLLVFFALIFVFPLHLVYATFFNFFSGGALSPGIVPGANVAHDLTVMFVCYGLSFGCMAGTLALLCRHGVRRAVLERATAIDARTNVLAWAFCAGVGLLSAALALGLAAAGSAMLVGWVSGFSYCLLAFTGPIVNFYRKRLEARLPA